MKYIWWELYTNHELITPMTDNKVLHKIFPGLYVSHIWNGLPFNWVVKNLFYYKFYFYFSWEEKIAVDQKRWNWIWPLWCVLQDNLETILLTLSIVFQKTFVTRIKSSIEVIKNNIDNIEPFILRNYNTENNLYRHSHWKNRNIEDYKNQYPYKFRLSNINETWMYGVPQNIYRNQNVDIINLMEKILTTKNEKLSWLIDSFVLWINLENAGFFSEAFNSFYKIIETEEKELINDYNIPTKKIIEELFIGKESVNKYEIIQWINKNIVALTATWIREKIYTDFNLTVDKDVFCKDLNKTRWKFSHSLKKIDYITQNLYETCRKASWEILINNFLKNNI